MGKRAAGCAAIVVAGSAPARSSAPLPNAGAHCRDRASSALSSPRQHRHSRPAIEQESGGVWGWRAPLSIRHRPLPAPRSPSPEGEPPFRLPQIGPITHEINGLNGPAAASSREISEPAKPAGREIREHVARAPRFPSCPRVRAWCGPRTDSRTVGLQPGACPRAEPRARFAAQTKTWIRGSSPRKTI